MPDLALNGTINTVDGIARAIPTSVQRIWGQALTSGR